MKVCHNYQLKIFLFFFSESDAAKYLEQQQRAQVSADLIDECVDQEVLTLGLENKQLIIF